MLKRGDAPYVPGRPKGLWWKWKRDPLTIDAVLMYAQRGHGKRSSFYSDYTFGVWRERRTGAGRQGVFRLHRCRNWRCSTAGCATTPSRASARCARWRRRWCWRWRSTRRSFRRGTNPAWRCGFPRIARIRTDKPAAEADRLETVMRASGLCAVRRLGCADTQAGRPTHGQDPRPSGIQGRPVRARAAGAPRGARRRVCGQVAGRGGRFLRRVPEGDHRAGLGHDLDPARACRAPPARSSTSPCWQHWGRRTSCGCMCARRWATA